MTQREKIIIGSDHAGFKLKETVVKHLKDLDFPIEDVGCHSQDSCDYPVYGREVAQRVANGEGRGILICGTGIGMSMAANKVPGVRAALPSNEYSARMSRKHNNANILVLGARVMGEDLILSIMDVWLSTEFDGGRHQRRLDLMENA